MTVEIPLTKGYVAIVDDEDADLAELKWCVLGRGRYAGRTVKTGVEQVFMHRLILARILGRPLLAGEYCDHINGDKHDNRRVNLRVVTIAENSRNRRLSSKSVSGLKGATYLKCGKWAAFIRLDGRSVYLGRYLTPEEAHAVYVEAAKLHYGEFAHDGKKPLAHITDSENS
jgi:hypothetical protein